MLARVDLQGWIAWSLDPPGPLGLLPEATPEVDVAPTESVYGVLNRALKVALAGLSESDRNDLKNIDPFRDTTELWMLGCPAEILLGDKIIHPIDSIGDVASASGSAVLVLKPRDDIFMRRESLTHLEEQLTAAIGWQNAGRSLRESLVSIVLNSLVVEPFAPWLQVVLNGIYEPSRESPAMSPRAGGSDIAPWVRAMLRGDGRVGRADEVIEGLKRLLAEDAAHALDEVLLGTLATVVRRHEAVCYNDFSVIAGHQCAEYYWIPFAYPSPVWNRIAEGEGRTFLPEMGAKLWRFWTMRNRIQKTVELLARYGSVDALTTERPLSKFLKKDEVVHWWLKKETLALRSYLGGVFGFPESFLALLKGSDVKNYDAEVGRLVGIGNAQEIWDRRVTSALADQVRIADVFKQYIDRVPGAAEVVFGQAAPEDFVRVHRYFQEGPFAEARAELCVLYNRLRNAVIHGVNFEAPDIGTLRFQHRNKTHVADYESLMAAYHLLPAVLSHLHDAWNGRAGGAGARSQRAASRD